LSYRIVTKRYGNNSLGIVDEYYILDELLGNIGLLLVLFTNITVASTYLVATGVGKRNTR
jgi:hypothetical protein